MQSTADELGGTGEEERGVNLKRQRGRGPTSR